MKSLSIKVRIIIGNINDVILAIFLEYNGLDKSSIINSLIEFNMSSTSNKYCSWVIHSWYFILLLLLTSIKYIINFLLSFTCYNGISMDHILSKEYSFMEKVGTKYYYIT